MPVLSWPLIPPTGGMLPWTLLLHTALQEGMKEMSEVFKDKGAEVYQEA